MVTLASFSSDNFAEMSRLPQLRAALERCQARVRYCEHHLSDYVRTADLSTDPAQRTHRKLAADLKRAIDDAGWLQKQLDDAMD
jgi:hypothetical protein